ncbi:E3 ubiquitin-protein ligase rnf103 [Plakobranchus ocellatus]|uniref:E3 ubiquitin-protein ligase rnf103 n=1 Tax=Plakobranchus ocellatus TaxID=259542 RepID=A0AAV4D9J2_9GAST|nr:E3 ubiquitin-protein ligase rnf103 [Plakobranchus ocellatus]
MWLKLCFLLLYVLLLFVAARILEALAWCEVGLPGLPSCTSHSCHLLDPVLLSVVQLKSLLDQRGLSYEGVVEKSELTELIKASGQVSVEEAEKSQIGDHTDVETNFTSGAHFIEQVEDAKDSVWLVQVSGKSKQGMTPRLLADSRWKNLKRKIARFGVRMGYLDCSLDARYCGSKKWHSDFVLLALPSQHQKKANVAMYNFSGSPLRETALLRWVRNKLDEKIEHILNIDSFTQHWQQMGKKNKLEPEVRVVLFTTVGITPLFYSALSVKFPGRVRFGLVTLNVKDKSSSKWHKVVNFTRTSKLPAYIIYTAERNYSYGFRAGEHFSFASMETFLKFLYPCLNDIFIISFCLANAISWLEPFVSNCSILKRIRKFAWCVLKYNLMVILLWLPVIGIFQMPYLDRFPLLALKCVRILSMSNFGQIIRGDYNFYLNHPCLLCLTFCTYTLVLAVLCKKLRSEEVDGGSDWFNFSQMQTLTHLRSNDFFEPMRIGGYDLFGGLDVFGSRISQPSLWLSPSISPEYIQHLPTWIFRPVPVYKRAQVNVTAVETILMPEATNAFSQTKERSEKKICSSNASRSLSLLDQCQGKHNDLTCSNAPETCASCVQSFKDSDTSLQGQHQKARVEVRMCSSCKNPQDKLEARGNCVAQSSFLSQERETEWKSSASVSVTSGDIQDPSDNRQCSIFPNRICSSCSVTKCHLKAKSEQAVCPSPLLNSSNGAHESAVPLIAAQSLSGENQCSSTPHSLNNPRIDSGSSIRQEESGFPAGYLESHQCVICLEEYVPLTSLCGLPCGHVFHEACIISWLNRDKHFCPMCRWPSYRPRLSHPR